MICLKCFVFPTDAHDGGKFDKFRIKITRDGGFQFSNPVVPEKHTATAGKLRLLLIW